MKVLSKQLLKGSIEKMENKKIMQDIWKEALDLEELPGTDESFFDLGGNSFVANKVFLMYEEKTGEKIEIADLFEKDTIDMLLD